MQTREQAVGKLEHVIDAFRRKVVYQAEKNGDYDSIVREEATGLAKVTEQIAVEAGIDVATLTAYYLLRVCRVSA